MNPLANWTLSLALLSSICWTGSALPSLANPHQQSRQPSWVAADDADAGKPHWFGSTIEVTRVTDAVKADIAARSDKAAIVVEFRQGATQADFDTVAQLPLIEHVRLDSDKITDLRALSSLKNLKEFAATGTDHLKSVAVLATIPTLEKLYLNGCGALDLSQLKGCANLRDLNLLYSEVSDVSALGGLKNLEVLCLNFSRGKLNPLRP